MISQRIERRRKKLKAMREKIESGQLNALRKLLTKQDIKQICEASSYYFRNRLLTPVVTVAVPLTW